MSVWTVARLFLPVGFAVLCCVIGSVAFMLWGCGSIPGFLPVCAGSSRLWGQACRIAAAGLGVVQNLLRGGGIVAGWGYVPRLAEGV